MVIIGELKKEFQRRGGILKTAELNELGLSSRQIKKTFGCWSYYKG
ncbi:hypothetical protein TSYNT_8234 [Tepidanaerobacter syntrophicus]|uniref:Uncharacterized protein n=1 Tax=Tepidanaerobacter syntrophicus TaxID=224999 RepID=A0A0U9HPA8_9FIRM|nr:hypothetical protein TSYNT_8234 [Tepidanaerobacter syntrophicus]